MLRKNTGYYDGWYALPSGHVEEGELPSEALIREVREEIGIELQRSAVQPVHVMYRTKHDQTGDRADYFFTVTDWDGDPKNAEPDKCEKIEWFPINHLPSNVMHHVTDALKRIDAVVFYSELGLDEVKMNPTRR